ncbi:hypothetical protein [Arthrobacter sp. GMC3]|uniref:hypothetical protein n=1 Tax=Arthrobacter sp. GMC3 TaxID=2058894 RepID=UPI000CE56608|nr:hypothetical protein [Arthrobacter sp. GMC3]
MATATKSQPGTVLRGIASGLFPMAGFTPVYALWAIFAWPLPGSVFFAAALTWSMYLLATAVRLISVSTAMPRDKTAFDARIDKGISILSGVQGGLIVTAIVLLSVFSLAQWIMPIVAGIVALHFFFMPLLFGRTIDYYLGSVMLAFAIVGLLLTSAQTEWTTVWGVVGVGSACVTSAFGYYMVRAARLTLTEAVVK